MGLHLLACTSVVPEPPRPQPLTVPQVRGSDLLISLSPWHRLPGGGDTDLQVCEGQARAPAAIPPVLVIDAVKDGETVQPVALQ